MNDKLYGNIHSLETFGTVDGPGIRFVIFMQGCPMRCVYCHNPDTWSTAENKRYTASELIEKYESVKEFLKNGGITVTGGEPLMQTPFVTELFRLAKQRSIHTALDTSGILFNINDTDKINILLEYTDLVLLDIKHINNDEHKKLTGFPNTNVLTFAKYLSDKNIPVWIRHVVVPSITDKEEYLVELGRFLKGLNNIKALDVLPYHDMAIPKYKKLGIEYKLNSIAPATKEQAIAARNIIFENYRS